MTELEIIEKLRENSGVYLGGKSLTALVGFVGGYINGMSECGIQVPQDTTKAMQEFVRSWYGIEGHFHWSRILLFVCKSEEAAFDEFFELLDLYSRGVDPETKE